MTLNSNHHYGVKMITTLENNLQKHPTSLQSFKSQACFLYRDSAVLHFFSFINDLLEEKSTDLKFQRENKTLSSLKLLHMP